MSEETQNRARALVLFVAPVVLLIGFLVHPYVSDESDTGKIAEELAGDPERWAWGHLILLIGMALTLLAVFSIRQLLRAAGEERWSFGAVPLLVVGATMIAGLVGAEVALAGVANASAVSDLEAVLDDVDPWLTPMFLIGAVIFSLGWLAFAVALYQTQILGRQQTWVAIAAIVVLVVGMFIPATGGGYVVAVGAGVASWLIAYHIWSEQPVQAGASEA